MAWPREQKRGSRERILASAIKLFAASGYSRVTIADVMSGADMTHGAFYAHFQSKQALYAEAVTVGAREAVRARLECIEADAGDLLTRLFNAYLDPAHVYQEQPPCPLAFLATDVANQEQEVRSAYTQVFKRLAAFIDKELSGGEETGQQRALALSALMVGGVAIARALDDERTVLALLDACRAAGEQMIEQS